MDQSEQREIRKFAIERAVFALRTSEVSGAAVVDAARLFEKFIVGDEEDAPPEPAA